jgi:hypothetical protein
MSFVVVRNGRRPNQILVRGLTTVRDGASALLHFTPFQAPGTTHTARRLQTTVPVTASAHLLFCRTLMQATRYFRSQTNSTYPCPISRISERTRAVHKWRKPMLPSSVDLPMCFARAPTIIDNVGGSCFISRRKDPPNGCWRRMSTYSTLVLHHLQSGVVLIAPRMAKRQ